MRLGERGMVRARPGGGGRRRRSARRRRRGPRAGRRPGPGSRWWSARIALNRWVPTTGAGVERGLRRVVGRVGVADGREHPGLGELAHGGQPAVQLGGEGDHPDRAAPSEPSRAPASSRSSIRRLGDGEQSRVVGAAVAPG